MSANAFSHTTRLSASAVNWLKAKLAKWPQVEIQTTPVEVKNDWDEITIVFDTCVSLNAPVIPGHTLAARLEHTDEGNIVYRCAGPENPAHRTCKPWCDHCKTSRRRNDTFILLTESGVQKQVGRNCLAEYVRDENAAATLLNWASILDNIVRTCTDAEERFSSGRIPETYTLPFVIGMAMAYGKKWVSASQAREQAHDGEWSMSSAAEIMNLITSARTHRAGDNWWTTNEGKFYTAMKEKAAALIDDPASDVYKVIAWIGTLANKPSPSDYEHNLSVIHRIGFCTAKQWGFVCSAFRAWLREQYIAKGAAEKAAREAAPVTGNYVGEIGKRMNVAKCACVLVKSLGMREGYGYRSEAVEGFLIKFVTPSGDTLTWFTNDIGDAWEQGKEYDIAFTPKKHEEYNKVRQTMVNRVAIFVEKTKKPRTKKPAA